MIHFMRSLLWMVFLVLAVIGMDASVSRAEASAPGCGQAQVERLLGAPPPPGPSAHYIEPRGAVTPFYQWENNDGYCGEVSLMQAGLENGLWMSQFNTRLVCGAFFGLELEGSGASLLQAGNPLNPNGHGVNYNAQLDIEDPNTGASGPYDYAHVSLCGSNARLTTTTYPYTSGYQAANLGMAGYRDYMSWIKSRVIAGDQVTLAVLFNGGNDAQYDHEVTVIKIGTNHSPTDPAYYDDDVVYFDDHGVYTLRRNDQDEWGFAGNPAIPLGAGSDTHGCTPYVFAYRFGSLPRSRQAANADGAPAYSIVIPEDKEIVTGSGNEGRYGGGLFRISGPHNYGFAIAGPDDPRSETMPVVLKIVATSTLTNGEWRENPWDANSIPSAGNNYENPYIGAPSQVCNEGDCATNVQPAAMIMVLQATVSKLIPGVAYNLYEYDLPTLTGAETGAAAKLPIPTEDFNAHHARATYATSFKATKSTYTTDLLIRTSDQIVAFRAVPADAP